MKPYVCKMIPESDIELFYKVKEAVNRLPDEINLGIDSKGREILLSCHILARAVSKVFNIKYLDGYFHPNFEHSWLLTENGHVIDVYPVAIIGGPILMDGKPYSPARILYIEKDLSHRGLSNPSILKAVEQIQQLLK